MNPTWLVSWELNQEKPIIEYNQNDETISFATFPDNSQSFVVFEGFLFDKHNFRAPISASDAERVIEYFNIFGEELFSRLRGAFSLVIWDAAKHRLIAGRDHMGQIPIYYYAGNIFHLSSSMNALLNQPGIEGNLNRILIAEHLVDQVNDHQTTETFFEGILRLPPAHYFVIEKEKLTTYRYWDPLPPGVSWATAIELKTFTDMFEQAVSRCLSIGADSIALSGGFDSTSLAVMASKIQKQKGTHPLHAISGLVANTGADEGHFQLAVAEALSMPQSTQSLDEALRENAAFKTMVDTSPICPSPNINLMEFFFSGQLKSAAKLDLNKLIMGTGGDEIFLVDGSWAYYLFTKLKFLKYINYYRTRKHYLNYSRKRALKTFFLGRVVKPLISTYTDRIRGKFFNKADTSLETDQIYLPSWISKTDRDLLSNLNDRNANPIDSGVSGKEHPYFHAIRTTLLSPLIISNLEHRYFYAKHVGYNVFYPFYDPDLMTLVLRMHPSELLKEEHIKAPLQIFLQENLPEIQIPQNKTDYTQPVHQVLRTAGKLAWATLGNLENILELGIINREGQAIIDDYFNHQNNNWHLTWQLISTEIWLRSYSNYRRN